MAKAEPNIGFDVEAIPDEMAKAARWVCWKPVQRDGRWTKVPMNPHDLSTASSIDPATWGTLGDAVEAAVANAWGIGFTLGDGWLGVDFDGLPENPELSSWCAEWAAKSKTYVEVSPSKTGLHAIFRGVEKPIWSQNRRGPVELYERARFFCVTGWRVVGDAIGSDQSSVDAVADRWLRAETIHTTAPRADAVPALGVSNGDPSAADWSMCCDLAARGFRLEEIVGRLREKMNREGRHEKAARDDYVVGTARKALATAAVPEAAAEPLSIKPMRSVMTANPTKTPYVISRLLRRGEVAAVIAPPKARKSFLVADLAIAGATGTNWFGQFPVSKGRVLLVDNELSENEISDRMRSIVSERGVELETIADSLDVLSLRDSDAGADQVIEQLQALEQPYDLIVFDALYMFLEKGMDENSNADMTVLLRKFRRLAARTGAAVVLVHHTSKGAQAGKEAIDLGAGAGALGRAVDANIAIYRHAEEGHFVMRFNVRSSAPVGDLGIRWNYPAFSPVFHGLDLDDVYTGRARKKSD